MTNMLLFIDYNTSSILGTNLPIFPYTSFPLFQVGCFDPYSDDPRLGVQKIHLCKYSGYLTVAGTAGQVKEHRKTPVNWNRSQTTKKER